ncbi:MAG TPA: hypothetical protein VGW75_03945 [Solirubrobacteraceae bacterium]|jgi:hypothetical protein|nr:hypothetical protein [Solirubrobacteraceae bacterium]
MTRHHGCWAVPAALSALLAALWLLFAPPTPDLAAQVYRTGLFEQHGFTLFNAHWYAGHHTPGYSLTFPPLAALIGPRVVGAIAAVVSAALFARLAHDHFGEQARAGTLWFAAATATDLLIGRLTFALGVTFALAALLALRNERTATATALAVATTAASPVAGLFLAMGGVAHALASRTAPGLALAAGAFAPALALALAFPEGGSQPFGFWAFAAVVAAAAAVHRLLPAEERTLRTSALLYGAATVAAFAIATPMGSNATRLAAMFAGPVLACALVGRARPRLLAAAAIPLLVYQWYGPVREAGKGATDPSSQLAFYKPLLDFLEGRADASTRVEIPFTRMHWESVHVARRFSLARGWEAQLDVKYNPLFRQGRRLTSERYKHWLIGNGVRYVALPDVPLDPAARDEARLIRRGLPFLRPVYQDRQWTVFEVRGAAGLTWSGDARVRRLGPASFTLHARRAGPVLVRVRWTPYWRVTAGSACVERGGGGWTLVRARRPGTIRVAAKFDPVRIVARGPSCGGDPDHG